MFLFALFAIMLMMLFIWDKNVSTEKPGLGGTCLQNWLFFVYITRRLGFLCFVENEKALTKNISRLAWNSDSIRIYMTFLFASEIQVQNKLCKVVTSSGSMNDIVKCDTRLQNSNPFSVLKIVTSVGKCHIHKYIAGFGKGYVLWWYWKRQKVLGLLFSYISHENEHNSL